MNTKERIFQKQGIGIQILIMLLLVGTPAIAEQIVEVHLIPENSSGLAWDGNVLWMGGIGEAGGWIRAFDPEQGEVVDSIPAPVPDCLGLAYFNGRLTYLSSRDRRTYYVSRDGYEVAFESPVEHLGGLGVDGATLWGATYSTPQGSIMQMNAQGEILRSLPFSCRHSRDVAIHAERIYVADRLAQQVRVVNPVTGTLIRVFPTPGMNPDGLASDGNYIWLMDDGDNKSGDMLYKLLVRPDGNMRFSSLQHNYGSVVINEEEVWTVWVYNDGARTARLVNFESRNGNDEIFIPHWALPREIEGGDSASLRISFEPAYEDSVGIEFGLTYDIDREAYWIGLKGNGVRPQRDIVVNQHLIDFGTARCGEFVRGSNLRYLDIENNGGEPLTIEDLQFSNQSFFHGFYDFPLTLEEPGLTRIPIFFRPDRWVDSTYQETVIIVSDDPDSPEIRVLLNGRTHLDNYNGGEVLWSTVVGDRENSIPRARAIVEIDDVTGDGLRDVVIATNDYLISAYHAASSDESVPVWTVNTNINPWRQGLVHGIEGMSAGGDWNNDGVTDLAVGLEGGANEVLALSGRNGETIWTWDSHGLHDGGGNITVANGKYDFTGDGVNDVFIAINAIDQMNATIAVGMLNGEDGSTLWIRPLDELIRDLKVADDFTGDGVRDFFVLNENGDLCGIDGQGGRVVWENHNIGVLRNMFPLTGDANGDGSMDFAVVTADDGLYCYNGSNGVRLWSSQVYDDLEMGVSVTDINGNGSPDILYGDDGSVRAIDGLTAEAAWDTSVYIGADIGWMEPMIDFDNDGKQDFMVGTMSGRLYALSGDGLRGLWSYSNAVAGRGFILVNAVDDVDGNGRTDVLAANLIGEVFCFAGSWIGDRDTTKWVPKEDAENTLPVLLSVESAFPNPFNSTVSLPFSLRNSSRVSLKVFNVLGREVYDHNMPLLPVGTHKILWNGVNSYGVPLSSGMYFMEIKSSSQKVVRSVELLR